MEWETDTTEILYNPRLPHQEREAAFHHLPEAPFKGHVWLSTSGSSGFIKWVALSKKALLASAKAVNAFLGCTRADRWLSCLPTFHVAGLGILARAHLSGAQVFHMEGWDPLHYMQNLSAFRITLSSLVPSQVFDLVQKELHAPPHLRALVVGGARLQPQLYEQARKLGWPLLPSYGMTETASMIATAETPEDPMLTILPHATIEVTEGGFLQVEAASLFTAYAFLHGNEPRIVMRPHPFVTEDRGVVQGQQLIVHGRDQNFIKIGGEAVDILRLERILEEVKLETGFVGDIALFPVEDERLGHVIHLASTAEGVGGLVEKYRERVNPFEKIRKVHLVNRIPRSPMRKLLLAELRKLIT